MPRARKRERPHGMTPRGYRTKSLGGRNVQWDHALRNPWAPGWAQYRERMPFVPTHATPEDSALRMTLPQERDARGRYRKSDRSIGTPHIVCHNAAHEGTHVGTCKATVRTAADLGLSATDTD